MSINFLQVIDGYITVPGLDLEEDVVIWTGTGVLITKAPTSIPLGILCNYVWDSKEGILLAPSYTNIGKISREFYSASNIYECLQQCESAIAAGGVYLRNTY